MLRNFALACALLASYPVAAAPREAVEVIVPERDNLQYLSFWLALGSGAFADEGLDVKLLFPDPPGEMERLFDPKRAQVAVLPPPKLLQMIAVGAPLRVVANLLKNDPIDLVVRRTIVEERKIRREQPLRARLEALRGLRIGVAPGPITRLRKLFETVGLVAEDTIKVVVLMGEEQNDAFADKRVDALYAHTPYLERALVAQDAAVVVDQAGGEVAALADRQIHTLVASDPMIRERRAVVAKLVRAIARGQELLHRDRKAALEAIVKVSPKTDRAQTARLLELYAPAVPKGPQVSVEGLKSTLAFYPASKRPPDLSRVDFGKHVDASFAPRQ